MNAEAEAAWWSDPPGGIEANAYGDPPYDVERVARRLMRWLRLDHTERVLDLGCGPGRLMDHIRREYGLPVVGVDSAPGMLAATVTKGPVFMGDGRRIPLLSSVIDAAYAITLFQHIPHEATCSYIAQVADLLPSGGQFVFTHSVGNDVTAFLHHQVAHPDTPRQWLADVGMESAIIGLDPYLDIELGWTWYVGVKP